MGSLFAIVSPFATVPTFLAITDRDTMSDRISMAKRGCAIACIVLVTFSFFGGTILGALRVSIPALQVAGGLVILRVAFGMLSADRSRLTPEERDEGAEKEDVAVTPLAIPVLCGPGTITTGIVLGTEAEGLVRQTILFSEILVVYAVTFALLWLAVRYSAWLGEIMLRVLTRLMGVLLAAIAVQFVINGARDAFGV
jgi:multiple antibiotic resistance protein